MASQARKQRRALKNNTKIKSNGICLSVVKNAIVSPDKLNTVTRKNIVDK